MSDQEQYPGQQGRIMVPPTNWVCEQCGADDNTCEHRTLTNYALISRREWTKQKWLRRFPMILLIFLWSAAITMGLLLYFGCYRGGH